MTASIRRAVLWTLLTTMILGLGSILGGSAWAAIPTRKDDGDAAPTAAPSPSPSAAAADPSSAAPASGGIRRRKDDDDEAAPVAAASPKSLELPRSGAPRRKDDDPDGPPDGMSSGSSAESAKVVASEHEAPLIPVDPESLIVRSPRPKVGPDPEELMALLQKSADPILEVGESGDDPHSKGCVSCHTGISDMHSQRQVGCTECHGGNAEAVRPKESVPGSFSYNETKAAAHVKATYPERWPTSRNPERTYTLLLRENIDWVKFVNPSDMRVAPQTCATAKCHKEQTYNVHHSMMNTGASLWGTVLYNNGMYAKKNPRYGEAYGPDGKAMRLQTIPPPTDDETWWQGILPFLDPLPRWEISQPGNILRVFERGGRRRLEVANQERDEDPGKPDKGLSPRGFGTILRTDPVFLGVQKTRLLDPILGMLGTNDHPGDYRSSGCASCHVVYANDRDPFNASLYGKYGNVAKSQTADPTIPKNEKGHPLRHRFTNAIPSSQCMTCHVHPGTNMVNGYFGNMWWDNETDGDLMYPKKQRYLKPGEAEAMLHKNPESASLRGMWSDEGFLENVSDLNAKFKKMQVEDFHGHGWVFRKIYKKDRKGNLLDAQGKPVSDIDPDKWKKAVHLKDIHLEKGLHCADCHFSQDNHGNGKLYGEVRNAIEVQCQDCHGTIDKRANLVSSGPAAPGYDQPFRKRLDAADASSIPSKKDEAATTKFSTLRTPFGKKRFEWQEDQEGRSVLKQRSVVVDGLEWTVVQVADTIDPKSPFYNQKSRYAKTIKKDGKTWGDGMSPEAELAHANTKMTCFACHSSWMTSCFGCHLSMKSNKKRENLHNEGTASRNWTSYNFQVLRDDVYMLGKDGTVAGGRISPVRSSSAVIVSSQNQNREWLYSQQHTFSAEGYSGQAFNTHVPHTVRGQETKGCKDCHVSDKGDNNAWMAQLLTQGTNMVNFLGRYVYVGMGHHGLEAVAVTEHDEPQAVYGSTLHKLAYPDRYAEFTKRDHRELKESYEHGADEIRALQVRGEYLYTANGPGGLEVFDVAQIDHKGFSERISFAPVSPLGQRTYIKTPDATDLALPSTLYVHARPRDPENQEQAHHPIYNYVYLTDAKWGLVVVDMLSLYDGNPMNNFLKLARTYNPHGLLDEARAITIAGHYAYVSTPRELVVLNLDVPTQPYVVARIGAPYLSGPKRVAVQFRYAFVLDEAGLKVIDITFPERPKPVSGAFVATGHEAKDLYVARTYAYIAAGPKGVMIVDVEAPERPKLDQIYTADGKISDAHAVRVGMTHASVFMYVADGKNGMHVIQLMDPAETPGHFGFAARPTPRWIARRETEGEAIALSKGFDRDRAVDESGHQIAVFGRRGGRPLNLEEMRRMYVRDNEVYTVSDEPTTKPQPNRVEYSPAPDRATPQETPTGNLMLRLRFE